MTYAGIRNTPHDLSANSNSTIKAQSTTEKCVFCHTPHLGTTGVWPLWNHNMSAATYTVLGASNSTMSRITSPGQPDGSSKLCLSCHDGTVAIGSIRNTPGRGSTGSIAMLNGTTVMPAGDYALIGTDIRGKHMVSIEYNGGLVTEKLNRCADGRADMALATVPLPSSDRVKTYPTANSNGLNGVNSGQGVQCRSCHDPHDNTIKCFLVKGSCSACPCQAQGGNWDALCNTCHYLCP